jgi:hypothetical protein
MPQSTRETSFCRNAGPTLGRALCGASWRSSGARCCACNGESVQAKPFEEGRRESRRLRRRDMDDENDNGDNDNDNEEPEEEKGRKLKARNKETGEKGQEGEEA